MLLKDVHPTIEEILKGQHDSNLAYFEQAVASRKKAMLAASGLRKGVLIVVADTVGDGIGGRTGIVLSVNKKTASVALDCVTCGSHDEVPWTVEELGADAPRGAKVTVERPPVSRCETCYGTPDSYRIPLPWLSVKPIESHGVTAGDGSTLGTALAAHAAGARA